MKKDNNLASRLKSFRTYLNLQQAEFAEKLGIVQQQLSKYENGRIEPTTKFYVKICEVYKDFNIVWLLTGEGNMLNSGASVESAQSTYFIPYFDGCPQCADKLKKASIQDGILVDVKMIIKEWGCEPKNVRLISTPGEEMDGGQYPIRDNDLLVIDISKTSLSNSGIFLITTHGGEIVMLRRLMELADGSIAFYIDNKEYAFAANKTYTREELEAMDFKVIGKVVKNITYAF